MFYVYYSMYIYVLCYIYIHIRYMIDLYCWGAVLPGSWSPTCMTFMLFCRLVWRHQVVAKVLRSGIALRISIKEERKLLILRNVHYLDFILGRKIWKRKHFAKVCVYSLICSRIPLLHSLRLELLRWLKPNGNHLWLAGKFTIWLDNSPMNTSYLIWLVVWLP